MVQLAPFAMAMAIGSAAAVPHLNLPAFTDLPFLESFTLPAFPGVSSTSAALPTALPGYGGGTSSSTSITKSSSKSPSGEASKPVSSIVPSGTTAKISSIVTPVGTGKPTLSASSSVSFPSPSSLSKTAVSVSPVKVTSKIASTGPAGYGKTTSTKKKTSTITSKPSASASKPSSSNVSRRPASSGTGSSKPPSTTGSSPLPTVSTTSGKVVGYPVSDVPGIWQYLGIKFGQAPVGDLRFAPPVAYTGTGVINGSTFGADCPCTNLNVPYGLDPRLSSLLNTLAQTNETLAEDCLFLNIWAKAGATNKPVLVWIFGGGFTFGGTASAAYNGRHFAGRDDDVIFVSLNYRTNVMGFGAPDTTPNVGLLDQRLALEWVRDNIAAFGGDVSRITIFGQSAGGASVDLYTFTYYEDPIIAGAIPMSGSATGYGARTVAQSLTSWDNVTYNLGCGNSTSNTSTEVLSCMRSPSITWQDIQDIAKPKPGLGALLGNFGPTVDEKVIFSNYTERVLDGYVAKVPVLTGDTNDESGLFELISIGAGESYPQSTWDTINLQFFICPTSRLARYRNDIGIPAWRYLYSGAWPNLVLPTANLTQAWHISDIPVLFGVAEEITLTANTANETALGDYMRQVWVDFAYNPLSPSQKYGWPQYDSGLLIDLGLNNETSASFSNSSTIEVGCGF